MSDMPGMVMVSAVELQALKQYHKAAKECAGSEGGCLLLPCDQCEHGKAMDQADETLQRIEAERK